MQEIVISEKEAGRRLDRFLGKYFPLAPASFYYKMLRKKNITLNGKKASGKEELKENDLIKLFLADDTINKFRGKDIYKSKEDGRPGGEFADRKLDIVYEDRHILVVNKAKGLLSQKADKSDISLVEYIGEYLGESDTFKVGICNRLDRNTSGLVVAGKSLLGSRCMNLLFKERDIEKYYLCLVEGHFPKRLCGRQGGYLNKNEKKNRVRIRESISKGDEKYYDFIENEFEILGYGNFEGRDYSILQVHLITGKSHQIRAQLSYFSFPIIGDFKYGGREINDLYKRKLGIKDQLLHAYILRIPLERMEWFKEEEVISAGDSYWIEDGKLVIKAEYPKEYKVFMK